jgi:RNA polymerase sigma-70 factor (ECF subfamily)
MHASRPASTEPPRRGVTTRAQADFTARLIDLLPSLRRYARAMAGDAALADDLVQDGIERALTRAETLRETNNIGAWLRRIVYNLYVDELRRRQVRGVPVSTEDIAHETALATPPQAGATASDVTRALATLGAEHRRILVLAGIEGLSYREIAAELNVPAGTVMSRLARARAALRAAMEGKAP